MPISDIRDDLQTLRQTMAAFKMRGTALSTQEQLTILDDMTDLLVKLARWTGSIMRQPDL